LTAAVKVFEEREREREREETETDKGSSRDTDERLRWHDLFSRNIVLDGHEVPAILILENKSSIYVRS
jgi:hypothetical protein